MEDDLPEYRLSVDRERAAASGLGSGELASMLGVLVGGQAVTTYEDHDGEAVNVRVRLPQPLRGDIRSVADLKASVPAPAGPALVPLTDLVTFTRATSPAEIGRRDLSRQLIVDANLDNLPLGHGRRRSRRPRPSGSRWRRATGGRSAATPRSWWSRSATSPRRCCWRHLRLPDPRGAVRVVHRPAVDHAVAAAVDRRHGRHARAHRRHHQHHVAHRPDHADGARHEERDPAHRLHEGPARPRPRPARGAHHGRPHAAAADHDDHDGDDLRHAAARSSPSARARSSGRRWPARWSAA